MAIEKIEKMPDGNYRVTDVEIRSRPYLVAIRQQMPMLLVQSQANIDLIKNNISKIDELIASEDKETSARPTVQVPEDDALAAAVAKK